MFCDLFSSSQKSQELEYAYKIISSMFEHINSRYTDEQISMKLNYLQIYVTKHENFNNIIQLFRKSIKTFFFNYWAYIASNLITKEEFEMNENPIEFYDKLEKASNQDEKSFELLI